MTDAGEVYIADLHDEQRRRVLVVSNARFNRDVARVVVAPVVDVEPDEPLRRWQVRHGDVVFALDRITTIAEDRLLQRVGRMAHPEIERTRRSLRQII